MWYETEGCVIGATELQQYAADSHSAINLGEVKAFTEAVEATLMDTAEDGSRAPVRVHVGWDSNDYQIDLATTGGLEQYKRMLVRDQSLGVTHAIFAPRNSLESTRAAATDAWGWEETLWLGLGEKIRRAQWLPQRGDAVPTEIANIVSFAAQQNIKLLAYVYPVLPFTGAGAVPRNGQGWLYDGRRDSQGHYQRGNNPQGRPNCTEPETDTTLPCSNTRASLANVQWQNYLAETMISFISVTGAGGFAFDYTGFNDWRQPTDYAEWRGWTSVLAKIRSAHPEIVIDHRQQCHNWGPWNQAAGTCECECIVALFLFL